MNTNLCLLKAILTILYFSYPPRNEGGSHPFQAVFWWLRYMYVACLEPQILKYICSGNSKKESLTECGLESSIVANLSDLFTGFYHVNTHTKTTLCTDQMVFMHVYWGFFFWSISDDSASATPSSPHPKMRKLGSNQLLGPGIPLSQKYTADGHCMNGELLHEYFLFHENLHLHGFKKTGFHTICVVNFDVNVFCDYRSTDKLFTPCDPLEGHVEGVVWLTLMSSVSKLMLLIDGVQQTNSSHFDAKLWGQIFCQFTVLTFGSIIDC